MKKRIIWLIVLAVVVVAVVFGIRWQKNRESSNANGTLKLYGTIDIRDANLAFPEQERIDQVLVEEGDRIEAGQVLARLKTERLEAQIRETNAQIAAQREVVKRLKAGSRAQEIEQARAQVAAAKADVQNADVSYKRIDETSETGASSDQALDDAKSRREVTRARLKVAENALALALEGPRKEDIAAAEKSLEALEAALSFLNVRLADMTLTAPAAGIVQSRILEPGEMAGPTKPVFTLALTDPKWARVYVSEPDLGRIASGMPAKVYSDSFPGEAIEGWIGFISPTAEFTPKAVQTEELRTKLVYEVRVFVKDPDDRLRLGMPVTVTVNE
jgi:HlyD family secretion protein